MCGEHSPRASGEAGTRGVQMRGTSIGAAVGRHGSLAASVGLLAGSPRIRVCSLQCSVLHPAPLQPGGGGVAFHFQPGMRRGVQKWAVLPGVPPTSSSRSHFVKPLYDEDVYCCPAFLSGKHSEILEKHCTGVQMALGEVL